MYRETQGTEANMSKHLMFTAKMMLSASASNRAIVRGTSLEAVIFFGALTAVTLIFASVYAVIGIL